MIGVSIILEPFYYLEEDYTAEEFEEEPSEEILVVFEEIEEYVEENIEYIAETTGLAVYSITGNEMNKSTRQQGNRPPPPNDRPDNRPNPKPDQRHPSEYNGPG